MSAEIRDPLVSKIARFLDDIGLPVRLDPIPEATFLPGLHLDHGVIVFDEDRLLYPGDLLHEAGHLALLLPAERAQANGDTGDLGGLEMGAIAWSYAAALHLGIDPAVVFHPHGYRGGSQALLENFSHGRYIGVPILEWLGLTVSANRANELGVAPYPAMRRWMRATQPA